MVCMVKFMCSLPRFKTTTTTKLTLASVAQLIGASIWRPKDRGFESQSRHMSRLQVWSPVGRVQKATTGCFPLTSMFLSLCPSLPLSLKPASVNSGEDKKQNKTQSRLSPSLRVPPLPTPMVLCGCFSSRWSTPDSLMCLTYLSRSSPLPHRTRVPQRGETV